MVTAVQDPAATVGETEIEGTPVFRMLVGLSGALPGLGRRCDNPRVRGPFARVLEECRPDVVHSHLIHTHLGYACADARRARRARRSSSRPTT